MFCLTLQLSNFTNLAIDSHPCFIALEEKIPRNTYRIFSDFNVNLSRKVPQETFALIRCT